MEWSINGTIIEFNVTANTTGWIGLGFNSLPSMIGADMYTGWVNDTTGAVTLLDTYGTGESLPIEDNTNNILTFSGSQVRFMLSIFSNIFPGFRSNKSFFCETIIDRRLSRYSS